MKLGIVSDSHGDTQAIDRMLDRPEAAGVELWLHAGDFTNDAEYLARMSGCEVAMVAGNNDWPRTGMPDSRVLDVAGHRIFLTHGHIYGVGYTTAYLEKAAAEQGADIAVYGHTHVAEIAFGEITVLNPGSVARPRDDADGSFLLLDLQPDMLPGIRLVRMR